MGRREDTVWERKPHTKAKHEILRRYLDAWLPIMSRFNARLLILDGFAGPGEYSDGSDGSPLIALNALTEHRNTSTDCEYVFLFNDHDRKRCENLAMLLAARNDPDYVKVRVENMPFTDAVATLLDNLGDKTLAPLFAFVDPFGYRAIPIATLRDLFAYDKSELLIYLDLNSLVRFGTASTVDGRLTELFGTDHFKSAPPEGPERWTFFLTLYERQLQDLCGFTYTRGFVMFGENNKPVCALVYATRHRKGMEVMKEAMWKVDPTGSFSFFDSTAGMQTLLGSAPDLTALAKAIHGGFAARSATVEEVEIFVYTETPNKRTHTRQALKLLETQGSIIGVETWSGRPRRRNTYPERCTITFT